MREIAAWPGVLLLIATLSVASIMLPACGSHHGARDRGLCDVCDPNDVDQDCLDQCARFCAAGEDCASRCRIECDECRAELACVECSGTCDEPRFRCAPVGGTTTCENGQF